MIFKILCAGTFLLLASIVFTVIYLSLMKAAKEDFKNEETESVFDTAEIKEVSLDDIPDIIAKEPEVSDFTFINQETGERLKWEGASKEEQYKEDISEAFPEEVVEAVTKDLTDEKLAEALIENDKFVEDISNITINPDTPYWNEVIDEDTTYKFLDILLPQTLQVFTQDQCNDYDVPYELVLALMESESSFREDIGSEKVLGGEEGGPRYYGYMQLSKDNCERAANTYALDAHTPEGNIEMAVLILSGYLEKYDNDWEKAIMAYKGGEGYADSMIAKGEVSGSAIAVTNRACWYAVQLGKRIE